MPERVTNSTILDRIRLSGTNDYQQRIPAASQAGVERVIRTLQSPLNNDLWNEFVNGLVKLIGTQIIRSREWVNPLAKFKRINIYQKQTIQEIGFELIKAKGFDPKDNDLFEENDPRIKAAYHSMNRQDRYDISFNPEMLENAFLTPYGLSDFMAGVMQVPINSDNYDEYNMMVDLISKYQELYGFYKVSVPNVGAEDATEANIKKFLEKVRATTGQLKFLKSDYNAYGIPTYTMPENSLFITTPEIIAKIDVNVLAGAFNVSMAEIQNKIILIDRMPIENCFGLLVDEDWFVCGDNLYRTDTFYNGMSLTTNYYLHHWETLSVSPFMNAIAFVYGDGTGLETVTVTPTAYDISLVNGVGASAENIALGGETYVRGALSCTVSPENRNISSVFVPSLFEITAIQTPAVTESATATKLVGAGITAVAAVAATFGTKVEEADGTYKFKATVAENVTTWKLGTATVDLTEYGVSVTGTVADGDEIQVVYVSAKDAVNKPLNNRTYVDRLGKIFLQSDVESGDTVTIKGTTTYNSDGVGTTQYTTKTETFTVV